MSGATSKRYNADDSMEDLCRVCKNSRQHTVVAVDSEGRILRVIKESTDELKWNCRPSLLSAAFIYIRQSTQHQVLHHLESQRRQRSLQERAVDMGWPRDLVTVVDEDVAQSAARCQDRTGFQKMVAEAPWATWASF